MFIEKIRPIIFMLACLLCAGCERGDKRHSPAFTEFRKQFVDREANTSKHELSRIFWEDVSSLGENVDSEILRLLAEYPELHSLISTFLGNPVYREGNAPRPYLCLLILHQGIMLSEMRSAEEDRRKLLTMDIKGHNT